MGFIVVEMTLMYIQKHYRYDIGIDIPLDMAFNAIDIRRRFQEVRL